MLNYRRESVRGQVLVVVSAGMLVIVALVGLVIDVGHAWGQQRDSQNGTDAAAHAGAIVLLDRMTEVPTPPGGWDEAVHQSVQLSAASNGITVPEAQYTDWRGMPFDPPLYVGPSDGLGDPPPDAQGVAVSGRITFAPVFAQVIGIESLTASAAATAVAGSLTDPCDTIEGCVLLPITFPATMVTCTDGGQSSIPVYDENLEPVPWPHDTRVVIPLCGDNPGSVGWIDWTPDDPPELEQFVTNPPLLEIETPSWQYITDTGGIESPSLENALNLYAGQIVMLPWFDSTCITAPSNPEVDGCDDSGEPELWYHVPDTAFAAFRFDHPKGAFTSGDNASACDTGNGATACLVGTFVNYVGPGTVGPIDPNSRNFGIQLIR